MILLASKHARREANIISDLNEVAERKLEATNPSQDYLLSYNGNLF